MKTICWGQRWAVKTTAHYPCWESVCVEKPCHSASLWASSKIELWLVHLPSPSFLPFPSHHHSVSHLSLWSSIPHVEWTTPQMWIDSGLSLLSTHLFSWALCTDHSCQYTHIHHFYNGSSKTDGLQWKKHKIRVWLSSTVFFIEVTCCHCEFSVRPFWL